MSRRTLLGLLVLALGGCDTSGIAVCDAGINTDGPLTFGVAVARAPAAPSSFDGGTAIPLRICARIPCLVGPTHAIVTTSSGTITGSSTVVLAVGTNERLEGDFELDLGDGHSARVTAQIGESVGVLDVLPPAASEPAPQDDPCAALNL